MNRLFAPFRGPRVSLTDRFLLLGWTIFWVLFASIDTIDSAGWGRLGQVWKVIQIVLAVAIMGMRVWVSFPVRLWRIRMDSAWQRRVDSIGLRVTARQERTAIARWMERHTFGVAVGVVCSAIVFPAVLARYAAHRVSSGVPSLPVIQPPVPVKLHASATVLLPDGTIRSGDVSVRQVSGQTYEVTFDKTP